MINVIIVSTTCSKSRYDKEQAKTKIKNVGSGQHFFQSLIGSLVSSNDCNVSCISALPQSFIKSNINNKYEIEIENNVSYTYIPSISIPIINTLFNNIHLLKSIKKKLKDNTVIIYDSLMVDAILCLKYAKKMGIKTIGVTMDLPEIIQENSKTKGLRKLYEDAYYSIAKKMLNLYDSYILMTEFMNEKCNKTYKSYLIIDCIAKDIELSNINKNKRDKPVVFYGGGLAKEYGLGVLIESCKYLKNICDVWLYGGECDFLEDVPRLLEENSNLVVHDVVDQKTLHELEANSQILINPRPTEEFTYYSFPSKTVEYMQLGVPVLMFKLPCLGKEYDEYLNYIEDYSPEGIANAIKQLLLNIKDANKKAKLGQQFVLSTKTQEIQGKKIVKFLNDLLNN